MKKFIKDVLNDRYALVIGNEIINTPKKDMSFGIQKNNTWAEMHYNINNM